MEIDLVNGDSKEDFPVGLIGGKAKGLLKLNSLEDKLYGSEFEGGITVPSFYTIPVKYDLSKKDEILKLADELKIGKFAVRSSSPYEDGIEHSFDGVFESILNVDRDDLIEAIKTVRDSALGEKAKKYSSDFNVQIDDKMAVIVQQMIDCKDKGIIYSKFPASTELIKILSWKNNESKTLTTLLRRCLREDNTPYCLGYKLIEGEGLPKFISEDLGRISCIIETNYGYPVRIEYQYGRKKNNVTLYLLQSRAIAGINDLKNIFLPEFEPGELLIGTHDINGQGDYTLPAVNICDYTREDKIRNLSYEEVSKLDQQFPNGYILICEFLQFWDDTSYDYVTPNKKAVVAGGRLGRHHDLDIAREKGLLYLGAKEFGEILRLKDIEVNTGEMLRVVCDGVRGLLYRVNQ
jgi:hypothetical protein